MGAGIWEGMVSLRIAPPGSCGSQTNAPLLRASSKFPGLLAGAAAALGVTW